MDISDIPPELRAKVMAALFQAPDNSKDVRRLRSSSFPDGVIELDAVTEPGEQQGDVTHNCDLLCPKCGAYELTARVATLVELSNIEPMASEVRIASSSELVLPALPTPPGTAQWWHAVGDPVELCGNLGFSRPYTLPSESNDEKQVQLFTCSCCDVGPLGWREVKGGEFWLACERVGYKVTATNA